MNMNSGYVGWSMSQRAYQAYEDGEMPLSKWNKKLIIEAIQQKVEDEELVIKFDIELFKKLSVKTMKMFYLYNSSWHHTGKYCRVTEFYSLNDYALEELTNEEILRYLEK